MSSTALRKTTVNVPSTPSVLDTWTRTSLNQLPENRIVERTRKLHAANVPVDPAHFTLDCLEGVELDPDSLAKCGSLDKLDFAPHRREIERRDPEAVKACAPNRDLNASDTRSTRRGTRESPASSSIGTWLSESPSCALLSLDKSFKIQPFSGSLPPTTGRYGARECSRSKRRATRCAPAGSNSSKPREPRRALAARSFLPLERT